MINWRNIYFISIGLRFVFALSNSYIHPDEHFQSLEVLTSKFMGYSTQPPWEFQTNEPARSLAPLYLIYGPILYITKYFNLDFSPLQILYLFRIQFLIISWIVVDYCIYHIMPTKPERIKAIFFTSTSYITLIFQSHTFSNSVETVLLMIVVLIAEDLRLELSQGFHPSKSRFFALGALIVFGIFNRVTFVAYVLFPLFIILAYIIKCGKPFSMSLGVISGALLTTSICVLIDTIGFGGVSQYHRIIEDPFNFSNYLFTPLTNLIYNSKIENLATHGLHPRYTHFLINLPQLMGPSGLMFLFYKGNKYWQTTPFITAMVSLVILSIPPHQELRFLTPLVPLLCCCFDLSKLEPKNQESNVDNSKSKRNANQDSKLKSPLLVKLLMVFWYVFNIVLCILMGIYHQGGVLPALEHLRTLDTIESSAQVWWRTYSPPTWLLGNPNLQIFRTTDANPQEIKVSKSQMLIDTMGSDFSHVEKTLNDLKQAHVDKIYLITPIGSFLTNVNNTDQFISVWNYTEHIDLDHIDNFKSLQPGLGIYEFL